MEIILWDFQALASRGLAAFVIAFLEAAPPEEAQDGLSEDEGHMEREV